MEMSKFSRTKSRSSPLRYPGGKGALFDFTVETIIENSWEHVSYAEPFAGGGGLALSLLYGGYVKDVYLNDFDPAIWSMWAAILKSNEEFVHRIRTTKVTIDEWHDQKRILKESDTSNILDLGFATFFLNRTNRSGILKGGVIGGKNQQGNYKLDCRFNKDDLIKRVERIGIYSDRIHMSNLDGKEFIKQLDSSNQETLFFIDPPYYAKGQGLYINFFEHNDHVELSNTIMNMSSDWLLTYDNQPEIVSLYESFAIYDFEINYSIQNKRVGTELLIANKTVSIPKGMLNMQNYQLA